LNFSPLSISCELCADGFYGNAMNQTPNDCQPCACPSIDEYKNFSPTCEGNLTSYICNNCNIGHVGDHCEKCDDGFYGSPFEGQQCRPCLCGKNPCDPITGECFECKGNTEGFKCEKCKENFFGDPKFGCEMCACSSEGAVDNVCDQSDGRCSCKLNYSGQLCDECAAGYANVSMNCPACNCHEEGSTQKSCNRENGQCSCKSNVHGLRCDECDEMFFGLSSNGCEGELLTHF
jgi:laminin, alpha 1/2